MVGVDSGSLYRRTYSHSLSRLAWSWVGGRMAPFYIHQMNHAGELSHWLCVSDSTINIVLDIIIIIIIITTNGWQTFLTKQANRTLLKPSLVRICSIA